MFRISESFTICDPAEWERKHPGWAKPFPLADTSAAFHIDGPCHLVAARLVEEDSTALLDKDAAKLERKMDELCEQVAQAAFGADADKYGVVFHPHEKRFWAFPHFREDGSPIT